jgi:hypothetical protein
VAQRVQTDSRHTGALGSGLEHAISDVVRVERPPAAVGEHEVLVVCVGESQRIQSSGELLGQRDRAGAVVGLRSAGDTMDVRPSYPEPRWVRVEVQVAPAQRDRLRDTSPVEASSTNSGWCTGGISASSRPSCTRVRKRRSLTAQRRPPRREGNTRERARSLSMSPSPAAAARHRRSTPPRHTARRGDIPRGVWCA